VETCTPQDCAATLQALREGCYSGAWCYDSTGGEWPVIEATLKKHPSLLERALPWRRVAVELHLGPRAEADLAEVLSRIGEVLRSENDFCERLKTPTAEIPAQFNHARTTADLIAIASRYVRAA
jgi:hypothetical protein